MDEEVLQKYKEGSGSGYSLVYDGEGMDDPFGDYPISSPTPLTNEKEILLPGEVTLSASMDDQIGDILNSYGGGGSETTSIAAYVDSKFYGSSIIESLEEEVEEEKEEKKDEEDLYALK